ncbi:MAG: hypothetical protein F6J93_38745 [Oscillatoria sp. SIO1A7]|nr:hypothetical protein [Oscillatoria sp. SIO1A7]
MPHTPHPTPHREHFTFVTGQPGGLCLCSRAFRRQAARYEIEMLPPHTPHPTPHTPHPTPQSSDLKANPPHHARTRPAA